jgi:hypothetical protein
VEGVSQIDNRVGRRLVNAAGHVSSRVHLSTRDGSVLPPHLPACPPPSLRAPLAVGGSGNTTGLLTFIRCPTAAVRSGRR